MNSPDLRGNPTGTASSAARDHAERALWRMMSFYGDPLADLGLLMVYWTGPDDEVTTRAFAATRAEGFMNRDEIARRYAEVSGRDISQLDFYVSFAFWKLACILEGVYARYRAGAMSETTQEALDAFREQVDLAAAQAAHTLSRLG